MEIVFNRLFSILLILSSAPLPFIYIFSLPTVVICVIFSLFLWFSKKYHIVVNVLFLIIAVGVYFLPLPIIWGFFLSVREFRFVDNFVLSVKVFFLVAPLIFIAFSVRNVLGNIFAYFRTGTVSRNLFYLTSLLIVLATLLAYPLFDTVRLRGRAMEDDNGSSMLSVVLTRQEMSERGTSSGLSRDYTARFDAADNKYLYRLTLVDPLDESVAFMDVRTDGEKINFRTDGRVECPNCQMGAGDPYRLVFPAGQSIDFIITSDRMIRNIEFTEPGNNVANFVFWK
jgi:hypothetical protein